MSTAITSAIITFCILGVLAQKNCDYDTDCLRSQYCYTTMFCVNYTNCSWYNRHESSTGPARSAEQCGECIRGFVEERNFYGVADNCTAAKTPDRFYASADSEDTWIFDGVLILVLIVGIICIAHTCWHSVRPYNNKEDQQPEKTASMPIRCRLVPAPLHLHPKIQSNPISSRPFGGITEEQEAVDNNGDNNTINETHDRLEAAGSLPALTSNRQEERDNWENNASGNSRNPRGNSNSFTINMQIFQTVNNGEGNGS